MPDGRTFEAKLSARSAVNFQHEFEVKESRYLNFSLIQGGPDTNKEKQDTYFNIYKDEIQSLVKVPAEENSGFNSLYVHQEII